MRRLTARSSSPPPSSRPCWPAARPTADAADRPTSDARPPSTTDADVTVEQAMAANTAPPTSTSTASDDEVAIDLDAPDQRPTA